jgi:hypothetical protein
MALSSFDRLRMRGAVFEGLWPYPLLHPELVEGDIIPAVPTSQPAIAVAKTA